MYVLLNFIISNVINSTKMAKKKENIKLTLLLLICMHCIFYLLQHLYDKSIEGFVLSRDHLYINKNTNCSCCQFSLTNDKLGSQCTRANH